jgi:parvulin-like peptidyl-prolyl isomerase
MPDLSNTQNISLLRVAVLTAVITSVGILHPVQVRSERSGTVYAVVNGSPIYQSDLACAVEADMVRGLFSPPGDTTTSKEVDKQISKAKQTLGRLIETELLYQESLKHRFPGLTGEAKARYFSEVKRLGGEKNLRSALSCNNMTPDQFHKAIFRNLSIKRFLDKTIYSKIVISPREIKDYYDQNTDSFKTPESIHFKQIFLRGPSVDDQKKWQSLNEKALDIIRSVRGGASFVNFARRYSEDPSGASNGGDMGVVHKGNLHDSFDSVLFSMEDGTISEPLKSRHGFYIFYAVERSPATVRPFEDVLGKITTTLRRKHAQEMIRELLVQLKTNADIVITGQSGQ